MRFPVYLQYLMDWYVLLILSPLSIKLLSCSA